MKRAYLFFAIVLILCCRDTKSDFHERLSHQVDLFFIENRFEDVLAETSAYTKNSSFEVGTLATLLQVGAYCELSNSEKAGNLLQNTDTVRLLKNNDLANWYRFFNGIYYFRTANYPQAFNNLSQVIHSDVDDRAKALSLRLLARIQFNSGDSNKATEYLAQSTKLFEKSGLSKSVAINHKILGRNYANKKEFQKANEQFEIAKAGLESANDSIELFYIHINLIGMQIFQGKFEEAKMLARKNAVYITEKTDRQALALLYNNLGEIEYHLQNYDSCRYYYQKTIDMPLGYLTDILRRGNACIGISKAYVEEKNIIMAFEVARQAIDYSTRSDLAELQYNANLNLADIYKRAGKPDSAYLYMSRAIPYLEKLGKKSVENSETVYQSTLQLLETENQTKKMKAEKQVYLILIIVGILFTISLFVYGISTYRLLRSRNEVLKALVKKNLQLISDERKLNEALHKQLSPKKLTRKSTDEEKDLQLFNTLTDWLLQGKQFTRKDLTLDTVARELATNREYLSRAISSQQQHFNEMINKYRIEEAIEAMTNTCDKRHKFSLNSIASDVGFKSNSVFIEAFRKHTGMNPAQFRATACYAEN